MLSENDMRIIKSVARPNGQIRLGELMTATRSEVLKLWGEHLYAMREHWTREGVRKAVEFVRKSDRAAEGQIGWPWIPESEVSDDTGFMAIRMRDWRKFLKEEGVV